MDIITLLKKDHALVGRLFADIFTLDWNDEDSATRRAEIFNKIDEELTLHTKIEETIFYPVIKQYDETNDIVMSSYEAHDIIKVLMDEIKFINKNEVEWLAKLNFLKGHVESHVNKEEEVLFPKVEKLLKAEVLEKLGMEMLNLKSKKF